MLLTGIKCGEVSTRGTKPPIQIKAEEGEHCHVGLVQAKLVRAVVSAALQKHAMGLSFSSETGLRSCSSQALGKQEQHHLCPISFEKEN